MSTDAKILIELKDKEKIPRDIQNSSLVVFKNSLDSISCSSIYSSGTNQIPKGDAKLLPDSILAQPFLDESQGKAEEAKLKKEIHLKEELKIRRDSRNSSLVVFKNSLDSISCSSIYSSGTNQIPKGDAKLLPDSILAQPFLDESQGKAEEAKLKKEIQLEEAMAESLQKALEIMKGRRLYNENALFYYQNASVQECQSYLKRNLSLSAPELPVTIQEIFKERITAYDFLIEKLKNLSQDNIDQCYLCLKIGMVVCSYTFVKRASKKTVKSEIECRFQESIADILKPYISNVLNNMLSKKYIQLSLKKLIGPPHLDINQNLVQAVDIQVLYDGKKIRVEQIEDVMKSYHNFFQSLRQKLLEKGHIFPIIANLLNDKSKNNEEQIEELFSQLNPASFCKTDWTKSQEVEKSFYAIGSKLSDKLNAVSKKMGSLTGSSVKSVKLMSEALLEGKIVYLNLIKEMQPIHEKINHSKQKMEYMEKFLSIVARMINVKKDTLGLVSELSKFDKSHKEKWVEFLKNIEETGNFLEEFKTQVFQLLFTSLGDPETLEKIEASLQNIEASLQNIEDLAQEIESRNNENRLAFDRIKKICSLPNTQANSQNKDKSNLEKTEQMDAKNDKDKQLSLGDGQDKKNKKESKYEKNDIVKPHVTLEEFRRQKQQEHGQNRIKKMKALRSGKESIQEINVRSVFLRMQKLFKDTSKLREDKIKELVLNQIINNTIKTYFEKLYSFEFNHDDLVTLEKTLRNKRFDIHIERLDGSHCTIKISGLIGYYDNKENFDESLSKKDKKDTKESKYKQDSTKNNIIESGKAFTPQHEKLKAQKNNKCFSDKMIRNIQTVFWRAGFTPEVLGITPSKKFDPSRLKFNHPF